MNNNLNNKLNRVDEAIANMRANLKIDASAPIEEVASTTSLRLKELLNIYVQETEPVNKDGIWFKMPSYNYESVTIDENCSVTDTITGDDKWPTIFTGKTTIFQWKDGYIGFSGRSVYYFNQNFEIIDSVDGQRYFTYVTEYNNKFYFIDNGAVYIESFDPETKEYTKDKKLDKTIYAASIGIYKDTIYMFGQGTGAGWKYNLKTKEQGAIAAAPRYYDTKLVDKRAHLWNGVFYIPNMPASSSSSSYASYIYNPETNTWTQHPYGPGIYQVYSYCIVGDCMYSTHMSYNDGDKCRKTNLLTGKITNIQLPWVPSNSYCTMAVLEGSVYIFNNGNIVNLATDTSSYDNNTIVVTQGQYKLNPYKINLFSLPETKGGKLLWSFGDAYPYKDGQLLTNIPSYYGNGTEWIKFKN